MIDNTPGYFFLYQADNAIFLHPLNYDMLISEHGSVEALPTSVEAKVIDIERAQVNKGLIKRYPFMDHLPQGTIILCFELDMTDIVSEETISQYHAKIQ